MKNIILIGDSIRMGYQDTVCSALQDVATIWAPEENGGASGKVRENLGSWALERPADLIHLNCGLHDLRKERDAKESSVPLAQFAENLRWIFDRLCTQTQAKIIWASITPVNQEWHHQQKSFDRFLDDVIAYNTLAGSIASEFRIDVNPLYAEVDAVGRDNILLPDGVHYSPAGYEYLGGKVAKFIKARL
ncbi:SGNH/GDSL hydrolase family protein [Kiritimatiellota bacterium B12222]|nr:SGNH/GDSL hydrolase family protein [Kiritimatiellota bacterium B12222]